MKKIKSILAAIICTMMLCTPVLAVDCTDEMCPVCPENISGPLSSALSKVTGMNWFLSSIIEGQVKRQMDKALLGDFKVVVTPYGAKSLLDGKFKKITAHSDSIYIEGLYLSDVSAESVCEYNHFVYKEGQVYTNENFIMSFSGNVTSEDLQKTVATPQYLKLLNSMNINVGNISVFKIFDPKAEIKNNRMNFSIKVMSPLTLNEPMKISSDMGLEVENGKIMFTDVKTTPNLTALNLNSVLPVINKLNPFIYKANIMNNSKSIIKIKDVNIVDNKIVIKGLVIVPKNYYNN